MDLRETLIRHADGEMRFLPETMVTPRALPVKPWGVRVAIGDEHVWMLRFDNSSRASYATQAAAEGEAAHFNETQARGGPIIGLADARLFSDGL